VLETSGLYYPNRIARYFFEAMEDVMGQGGLTMLLSLAHLEAYAGSFPPDDLNREVDFASLAALNVALEEMYGPRGGRGMALRIGRACFSQGMKTFGVLAGIGDPAFRALPLHERCHLGMQALVAVFNNFTDQHTSLEEDGEMYRMIVENSPMAWGRTADKPVCHALVGILQENIRWSSNGYEYYVVEAECHACQAERCVFTVNKTPIGQR
jgi:predicted hydrocarbon binding protein